MIGTKILEERKSRFNGDLRVVKSLGLGTYIQANGLTQSGGVVESIWGSTLKRLRKKEIKTCLILGLGGGTVAKLVRKIWPRAKITGVEIDPEMIELGKKYLGLIADKIYIEDAESLIKRTKLKYDLVVVDMYIGDKYPEKFEDIVFFKKVSGLLSSDGIAIFNRLYFADKRPGAVKFGLKLQKFFKKVTYYYPEANLMFFCYN